MGGMTKCAMHRLPFLRALVASIFLGSACFASAEDVAPVARKHQVNCQVGLSIRSKPAYESKRVALLEDGAKVTLAGKAVEGDKTQVVPVVVKDGKDADSLWIQISAPKPGYVLYKALGTAPHDYLVPAK